MKNDFSASMIAWTCLDPIDRSTHDFHDLQCPLQGSGRIYMHPRYCFANASFSKPCLSDRTSHLLQPPDTSCATDTGDLNGCSINKNGDSVAPAWGI